MVTKQELIAQAKRTLWNINKLREKAKRQKHDGEVHRISRMVIDAMHRVERRVQMADPRGPEALRPPGKRYVLARRVA